MKARNMALIGLGVLAVGGVAVYFLKEKGIIGDPKNDPPFFFSSDEEFEEKYGYKPISVKEHGDRLGIQTIELRKEMPADVKAELDRLKKLFPTAFSGIENLIL